MKYISPLFIILLILSLLSSCSAIKPGELSDRLIAEAIGIDLESGGFTVTVQALDIGASGSGEGTAADETTRIYSFYGNTPAAAFGKVRPTTGLNPLYSHARLLVISREAAENRLSELLDFFLREFTARSDILFVVAANRAADIISADLGSGRANAAIAEKTVQLGHKNGTNTIMPLYRFVNLMLTDEDSAYCPVADVRPSGDSGKQELVLGETAVFDSEKLIFTVDGELTEGILLLNNAAGNMLFPVSGKNGSYMLSTVKSKTKIKPSYKDGSLKYTIETKMVCDLTEFAGSGFRGINHEDIKEAEAKLTEAVEQKEKRALESVCIDRGCDICRLARKTLLRYPHIDKNILPLSSEKAGYELKITVSVRRTGREILKFSDGS